MYFGQNYGAFGTPDKHIAFLEIEQTTFGGKLHLAPATGLGNAFYQVYIDNVFAGAIYCYEGVVSDWFNFTISGSASVSIAIFRTGASPDFDNSDFARLDEESPESVTATFNWTYETLGTSDNTDLTSWVINNIAKSHTGGSSRPTRGNVDVTLTIDGSTATVIVGALASGSGSVGTTIALTALNGSGVTGRVDVDASATTGTGTLVLRWPKTMSILRGESDPPTNTVGSVPYNNESGGTYVDTVDTAGTYYYAFQGISDTDDIGDKSASTEIVVSGAPGEVTDLAYISGDYSNTAVGFTASDTSGATYNVYVQNPDDDYLDTSVPVQTLVAGSTSTTLPTITGYPGIAQVVIRAESGGIEEKNAGFLTLEYDSVGAYVDKRPNTPGITQIIVSNGTTIAVTASYDVSNEAGVATEIQLFSRTPSGVYNYTSPIDTSTLSAQGGQLKIATLSATLANGWHYLSAMAATATGQQSLTASPEVAVYVSDANIDAPTGTFELGRG